MAVYKLHLRRRMAIEPDEIGMDFRDLHHAYLEACKAIPDTAREELLAGRDPMACAFLICDRKGKQLMEVLFSEVLSPSEWRLRRASRKPQGSVRSRRVRDDLALAGFRRMFGMLNVGCVLMTPELRITEMNAFGARQSHVDQDAIRGSSILEIFDLSSQPKADFTNFMRLAQTGGTSQIIDMPYLVLDQHGETVNGWWNARTWPIFDDDDHVLGIVEWAEPFTRPSNRGNTLVRLT